MRTSPWLLAAALSGLAASTAAAEPVATSILIRGAVVHPVVGADLPNASVLIEAGKIAAVGADVRAPEGATVVEAAGMHLYPGFIDADTTLGLVEIPTVRGTVDLRETGKVNPNVRAEVAVNPASLLIPVARVGGVTTALVLPSGDLIAGAAALMNTAGWTWEEMLLRSRVGIHLMFPRVAPSPPWAPQKPEEEKKKERDQQLKVLNRVFDDADLYAKARAGAAADPRRKPVPEDVRLEALLPVLRGETPLIVTAPDLPTIKSAVEWAEKRKLKIVLRGTTDAWRFAAELAKKQIPVILPETLSLPERSDEPYDVTFAQARRLDEAGVQFCFSTGGSSELVKNLPYHAAMACAYGLDPKVALEALTIRPARIFGVDARVGSIEVGKDANLILTDGDPLEIRTHVLNMWIGGRPVDLTNKHTELYEKYRLRPRKPAAPAEPSESKPQTQP